MNVSTLAGSGNTNSSVNFPTLLHPRGIAINSVGEIFVGQAYSVRKISEDQVTIFAGTAGQNGVQDGQGVNARFGQYISALAIDSEDNIFVADSSNNRIRKITPDGTVSTFAGSGQGAFANGQGVAARFYNPTDIAIDSDDNVYVADNANHRIRKITSNGLVTTLAGSGQGYADGQGAAANFGAPVGVAVDRDGNVLVADYSNNKIRKITPTGTVTTLAGRLTGSSAGFADGASGSALFSNPQGIAVDADDNVYVAESGNHKIRKIDANGIVTTIAGSTHGFSDGQGIASQFNSPQKLVIDMDGNILVTDCANNKIRIIDAGVNPIGSNLLPELPSTHSTDFSALLEDPTYCDVEFSINNEKITAHRSILASRCDYFQTMFAGNFNESKANSDGKYQCQIEDTTVSAFKFVLRYLYTDCLDLPNEDAIDILRLADQYGIERLHNHAVRFCSRQISNANCVLWFIQADQHGLDDLRENAKRFLARNFRAIRDTNRQTLVPLAEHPLLMMEVMLDAI